MKKKFLVSICGVAIVAAVAVNLSLGLNNGSLSNLALSNIEALAKGEDPGDILYIVCLEDKNSVCVYQGNVVLEAYYLPHK